MNACILLPLLATVAAYPLQGAINRNFPAGSQKNRTNQDFHIAVEPFNNENIATLLRLRDGTAPDLRIANQQSGDGILQNEPMGQGSGSPQSVGQQHQSPLMHGEEDQQGGVPGGDKGAIAEVSWVGEDGSGLAHISPDRQVAVDSGFDGKRQQYGKNRNITYA